MKKYSLLTLATGLALSASAAEPITIDSDYLTLIPAIVASDAQEFLALHDDKSIIVLNSNIAPVANITLPETREITLNRWTQERMSQPKDLTLINTVTTNDVLEIDGQDLGITLTQALNYLQQWSAAETATIDGETVICTEYARSEFFGKTYPRHYYKLINGRWTRVICEYQDGEWGPYGEWGEVRDDSYTTTYGNSLRNPDLYSNGGLFESISVTQTFFNNDSKFEYIIEDNDIVEYTEERDGYRSGGDRIRTKGYLINNEDGTTLHTITLPAEYKDAHNPALFIISGKNTLQ